MIVKGNGDLRTMVPFAAFVGFGASERLNVITCLIAICLSFFLCEFFDSVDKIRDIHEANFFDHSTM